MLEHIIKQFLSEQRPIKDYKAIVKSASNYTINTAKAAGGVYAFIVKIKLFVAKPSDKQLRKVMSLAIAENPTQGSNAINATSKYANGNYIYLASNPQTDSADLIKFTVWVIDRQKLKDLSVALQDREKLSGFFFEVPTSLDFTGTLIGKSPIMSFNDMTKWFSILTAAAKKQGIQIKVPDIQKINAIESKVNTDEFKSKIVDITDDNAGEYSSAILNKFRGKAEISYNTTGQQLIMPISGRISFDSISELTGESQQHIFEGTFKNGIPDKGTLTKLKYGAGVPITMEYTPPVSDIDSQWIGYVTATTKKSDSGVTSITSISPIIGRGQSVIDSTDRIQWKDGKYSSNISDKLGRKRIYYLDAPTKTVYSIGINSDTFTPNWFSMTQSNFENWIQNPRVTLDTRELDASNNTDAATISKLNKEYPEAMSETIKLLEPKQKPVQFKDELFPIYEYELVTDPKTKVQTFQKTSKGINMQPPANKPQIWVSTKNQYTELKTPSGRKYYVLTDQIK